MSQFIPRSRLTSPRRQQGATLVVALVILVLIMMLGVVAVNNSSTQFKLSGNLQFEDIAVNNAETAIATGENWLATGANYKSAGFTAYNVATPQLHPKGHLAGLAAPANSPLTMAWDGTSDVPVGSNQRYMIELNSTDNRLLGSSVVVGGHVSTACNKVNTYTVTTRGQAPRGATKFVQSYYSVLSC